MIELFDSSRLVVKRDHSLAAGGAVLLATAGLMAAYAGFLHIQLRSSQSSAKELQNQLAALSTTTRAPNDKAAAPRAALLDDLQRQAEQLEREAEQAALLPKTAWASDASGAPGAQGVPAAPSADRPATSTKTSKSTLIT